MQCWGSFLPSLLRVGASPLPLAYLILAKCQKLPPPQPPLQPIHRKKRFTRVPSPAGISLTKLPLGRNNLVMTSLFPPRESLVVTSRLGDGKLANLFLWCRNRNIYPPPCSLPLFLYLWLRPSLSFCLFIPLGFLLKSRNRKSRDPREAEKKAKARGSRTKPYIIISVLICVYLCTVHLSKSSLSLNPIQNGVRTNKEAHKWVRISLRVYQRMEAGRCGDLGVDLYNNCLCIKHVRVCATLQ